MTMLQYLSRTPQVAKLTLAVRSQLGNTEKLKLLQKSQIASVQAANIIDLV